MRKFFIFTIIFSLIFLLSFAYFVKIPFHNANHYPLVTQMYDGSANIVSAIYLNFRLYDTLFELLIFSVAVSGVVFYSKRIRESGEIVPDKSSLVRLELFAFGIAGIVWGSYTALTGHLQAGGAFSGGAIGASGVVVLTLALGSAKVHALSEKMKLEFLENLVIFVMLIYVIFGNIHGGFFSPGFCVGKVGDFFSGRGALLLNSSIGFKVFVGAWIIFYEFSKRKESI